MATEQMFGRPEDRPRAPLFGGFVGAQLGDATTRTRITDLADGQHLLALCKLSEETWDTTINGKLTKSEVLMVHCVEVLYELGSRNEMKNVSFVDYGELPIFWGFVRSQILSQSTDEFPWVIGRISKGNQAYRIMPPTPEDLKAAASAMEMWVKSTAELENANDTSEEPF